VGAAVAWLAVAAALGGSGGHALLLAALALTVGLFGLLASRRGRPVGSVIALAAFCAALALAPLSARLSASRGTALAALARQRADVTALLTVTADPHLLAATGVAGSPRAAIDATLRGVLVAGRPVTAHGSVVVLGPAALWRDVLPGQRIRLDATVQPPLGDGLLDATLVAESGPMRIGQPPWWQRAAGVVRARLRRASARLPRPVAGLLPGLVDGDTAGLDPVLAERFRIAGLTHLVAVSGTNCAIMVGAVLLVMRRLRAGPRACAGVGAVVLLAFVIVARPSPSVLRAALMASIALYGLACGRERDVLPALSAAVLGLLLWQPQLATDAGFAMSVLATAALVVLAPGWAGALRRRHLPVGIAEPLAVAAAAHVVTAPVVAAIAGG
jgi:competence protein ComEC